MPARTSKNSSPKPGQSSATTPLRDLSPALLQQLSALGIDPASLPEPDLEFVGISSALGPAEAQPDIDAWIEAGGMPEFDER